jgi:opacity protein-like surface antigen
MHNRFILAVVALISIASVAHATTAFDSVEEFSVTQGQNNWFYGYYDGDSAFPFTSSDFEEMPQSINGNQWIIHRDDPSGYWTSLYSTGGHPNGPRSNYYLGTEHWAVRRWVSDLDGTISITGNIKKSSRIGDGTICNILVNDDAVYSKHIYGTEASGVDYSIDVEVHVGDTIDFAIQPGANDLFDSTLFTAIGTWASYLEPPEIAIEQPLNIDGCIEATSADETLISAYVGNFMDATNIVYYWSNSDGFSTTGPIFEFPLGVNQGTIVFLTVQDLLTDDEQSSFMQVCASDTTGPSIEILDPVNGDIFNGNNLTLNVIILDAVDTNIFDYTVHVGSSATCSVDPDSGYSSVRLFKPSSEFPTEITVTAKDMSGNTSQTTVQVMLQHDNRKK